MGAAGMLLHINGIAVRFRS